METCARIDDKNGRLHSFRMQFFLSWLVAHTKINGKLKCKRFEAESRNERWVDRPLCAALWVILAFDFPSRQSDMSAADTWIRPSRQLCSSPAKSASFVLCCTLSFNVPVLWPAQLRWNRCYRKSITWDWAIQHWRRNWLRLVWIKEIYNHVGSPHKYKYSTV